MGGVFGFGLLESFGLLERKGSWVMCRVYGSYSQVPRSPARYLSWVEVWVWGLGLGLGFGVWD
jgi:hypothetical protein